MKPIKELRKKIESLKSRSGRMGSGARASHTKNSTVTKIPDSPKPMIIGDDHG